MSWVQWVAAGALLALWALYGVAVVRFGGRR